MKSRLSLIACIGLITALSGCASNNCSPSPFGQFLQNQPVRSSIRSLFTRGDECNTCNPSVGQPTCGTNMAPMCNACGSSLPAGQPVGQPIYSQPVINDGVSLYNETSLNAPTYSSPVILDGGSITGSEVQGIPVPLEGVQEPGVLPPGF